MTMKIVFKADALEKHLKDVIRVVPNTTTRQYLKFVLITANKDDYRVDFYASSEDQSVRRTIFQLPMASDVEIHESGSFLVNAKDLFEIVKKASGSITFESIERKENTEALRITFGKVKFELAGLPTDSFTMYQAESNETQTVTISALALRRLIHQTSYATAKSEVRPVLTGVNFVVGEGSLSATATDGLRLSRLSVQAETAGEGAIVVSGSSLARLEAMLPSDEDEQVILEFAKNALLATWDDDGTRLMMRALDGTYPDADKIIPTNMKSSVTVNRVALLETCDRVSLMGNQENKLLEFKFLDGELQVSAKSQQGHATDTIAIVRGESSASEIYFHGAFWMDLLKSVHTENVRIGINAANQPCVVSPDGEDGLALICPVLQTTVKEEQQSA